MDLEVLRWVSIYVGPIDLLCGSYHQKPANGDREGGKKPSLLQTSSNGGGGVSLSIPPLFAPRTPMCHATPLISPSLCNPNLVIRETLPTPFLPKVMSETEWGCWFGPSHVSSPSLAYPPNQNSPTPRCRGVELSIYYVCCLQKYCLITTIHLQTKSAHSERFVSISLFRDVRS